MPTVRSINIASGDLGTDQTVHEMANLIRAGALTPQVRNVASRLVAGMSDPVRQMLALRQWLSSHFQFVRDPASGELLHDTTYLLNQVANEGAAIGDCDDAAILGGALACAVGFRVALITVAVDDGSADDQAAGLPYSHVWASVAAPDGPAQWMEFDITRPAQYDAAAHVRRAKGYPVC